MFSVFHRDMVRPKTALRDFSGAAQSIVRWLSLPKRRSVEPSLQLLESVPVSAQASVVLIRFEQETFVLGVTPQNVTLLTKSAAPAGRPEALDPIP
jgi:flagellar biogenesis protein FliO